MRRRVAITSSLVAAAAMSAATAMGATPPGGAGVSTRAHVIGRPAAGVVCHPLASPVREQHAAVLVDRPVVEPAATVSRALSEQPVHPYLAELKLVHTTIYIDPRKNYMDGPLGGLDRNHDIVKAKSLYLSLHARPAHVVRRPATAARTPDPATIQPKVILFRPDVLDRPLTPAQSPLPEKVATPPPPEAPEGTPMTPAAPGAPGAKPWPMRMASTSE